MPPIQCEPRLQKSAGLLGLLILLRNAPPDDPEDPPGTAWDLDQPVIRIRLEKLLSGQVYKAYGSKSDVLDGWSFFCVAELRDLEAWNAVQSVLEECREERMIESEVLAFGRRPT